MKTERPWTLDGRDYLTYDEATVVCCLLESGGVETRIIYRARGVFQVKGRELEVAE